jgi:hypothetical protein
MYVELYDGRETGSEKTVTVREEYEEIATGDM